jgi:hypothetical protein
MLKGRNSSTNLFGFGYVIASLVALSLLAVHVLCIFTVTVGNFSVQQGSDIWFSKQHSVFCSRNSLAFCKVTGGLTENFKNRVQFYIQRKYIFILTFYRNWLLKTQTLQMDTSA